MDEAWIIVEKNGEGKEMCMGIPQAMGMAVVWLEKFARTRGEQVGIEPVITGSCDTMKAVVGQIEFYLKPAY